jgi:methyltransferase-like protein
LFWIRVIDRFKNINISSLRRRLESAQDILKKIYEEVKKKSLEDTSWKIEEKKKIKKIIEAAVVCLILELARRP